MHYKSDLVWAVVLIGLAAASFFLGMKKSSLETEAQLKDKLEEIRLLENKNQQLSEELQSRGVFGYPQANIVSKLQDSVAMVLITLNGKDPIEDLRLKRKVIYDYSGIEAMAEEDQKGKLADLGTLKPHNPSAFDIPLTGEEVAIHLEYKSKRKQWHQYIRVKKTADGEIRSFWVITNQNSVVIDKHIDPGFPTNREGKVTLWKDSSVDYSELEMNSVFNPGN